MLLPFHSEAMKQEVPWGPYPLIGTRKQEPNRLGTPKFSLSSLVDELFSKGGLGPPALKAAGTFSFPLLFLNHRGWGRWRI